MRRLSVLCALVVLGFCPSAWCNSFSFSQAEQALASQANDTEVSNAPLISSCRNKIKNQKILVLFGEVQNGMVMANQSNFSPYFDTINGRLRNVGLRTLTEDQIRKQVAQAEIDAYFKNDPDAALSASRRMSANYILKGLITTNAGYNLAVNVNQVSVRLDFTLTDTQGRLISQVSLENASYAGHDTAGMAQTLISERADALVAKLYNDYCQGASKP